MDELKKEVDELKKAEELKNAKEAETVVSQAVTSITWDTSTPHADRFAIKGNTITIIEGDKYNFYQLVGSDHLPKGSTTIIATIKQYGNGDYRWIGFGLLTESRRS